MRTRTYCIVFGCMNSSIAHPEHTFFRLPVNSERRLQWLKVIHREDLESKPNFSSYRVCEKHFDVKNVMRSANKKFLKKNTLPSVMLPSLGTVIPEDPRNNEKQTQTDPLVHELVINLASKPKKEDSNDPWESIENASHADFYKELEIDYRKNYLSGTSLTGSDDDTCQTMKEISAQLSNLINSGLVTQVEETSDVYDHFGRYVASLLRSLPGKKAMDLQSRVVEMIAQAYLEEV